jgi:hypothetical protein
VNVLCDNALLTGYALGRKEIDPGIIREVAEDLSITTNLEARVRPIRQVVNNTKRSSVYPLDAGLSEERSGVQRSEFNPVTVKPVPKNFPATAFVPVSFLNVMVGALTDAMGPMAKIVLRDQIKNLGESFERFPQAKVEILLESVSREILDEGMRAQFRHRIIEQIRTMQAS